MTQYVPDRNDIIFGNFEPVSGTEGGKYRSALVLSSKQYNQQTGLLICCPISTSIRGHATEVVVGNLDEPSVVTTNLIQTLSWKERQAQFVTTAENGVMDEVLVRIIPLIGADSVIEKFIE
ncbi:type II toxin-antitoxin system PemK/MazF family toxin [Aeromonas veronii]|nr:type II toxin-antitoxin system PemK/MazF family toxin [Aeromonas veronii]